MYGRVKPNSLCGGGGGGGGGRIAEGARLVALASTDHLRSTLKGAGW